MTGQATCELRRARSRGRAGPTSQVARRPRGFSLLEVLLAIALLGSGIMSLLVVRSNCIDNAADTIRLRSVRLLVARHAGHHLAYHCDPARTPAIDDWQEEFPEYVVDPQVEEIPLIELLPDELTLLAQPKEQSGGPGGSGSGSGGSEGPGPAGANEPAAAPLMLRKLTLLVAPPGAQDVPALTVQIVTFKLAPPPKTGPGDPAKTKAFPEYPAPLVGPDAAAPEPDPGTGGADPGTSGDPGSGDPGAGPPDGGN